MPRQVKAGRFCKGQVKVGSKSALRVRGACDIDRAEPKHGTEISGPTDERQEPHSGPCEKEYSSSFVPIQAGAAEETNGITLQFNLMLSLFNGCCRWRGTG